MRKGGNTLPEELEHRYDDIIGLPRPDPDPRRHPRMSLRDRAAQFAPFAALTGYGDIIEDTARKEQGKWEEDPEWWDDGWTHPFPDAAE